MATLRIDEPRDVPWPSIPHLVADRAARGDRVALSDDGGRVSFAELGARMDRVARAVVAMGIEPGARVALWGPNSAAWVEVALGVLASGALVVPLSTRLKGSEAAYAVRQSGASLIFTVGSYPGTSLPRMLHAADPGLVAIPTVAFDHTIAFDHTVAVDHTVAFDGPVGGGADPVAGTVRGGTVGGSDGVIGWADFLAGADRVEPEEIVRRTGALGQKDPAFVVFTSGTTGRPKGAVLHHGAILYSAAQMGDGFGLVDDDRMFVVLPLFHVFGLAMLFASLLTGGRIITTAAPFDPDRFVARLESERITVVPGPPTLFDALLASPRRSSADLSALRTAFIASTGVPGSLVRRLDAEGLFAHVVSGYGSTEGLIVSLSRLDEDTETTAEWSGQILPEADVRVVDADGRTLGADQPGELLVRTPSTTAGYLGDPQATAAAIDGDGWLHTGDVGIVDRRGYVRITDRLKDMFIAGGFNAYPAEIERLLHEHPAVEQAAVIGMPDTRLGEVGAAFVVLADGAELTEADLVEWARGHMANYKVPRLVRFVESLPMTASLKVAKFELRQLLVDHP